MKGPTVFEVSNFLNKMSLEHYNRFLAQPLQVRMDIIRKLIRKGELWENVKQVK